MGYRRGQVDRDVHLVRDLRDRLRRIENKRGVTVGPWRLDVDQATGDLVAVHAPTGARRVLCAPDPGDPDPGDGDPEPGLPGG